MRWHFSRQDGGYIEVSHKGYWGGIVLARNDLLFLNAERGGSPYNETMKKGPAERRQFKEYLPPVQYSSGCSGEGT
jgi:hypothetical protein